MSVKVGEDILYFCNKCKLSLSHLVEASFEGVPCRVMCNTCKRSSKYSSKFDKSVKKVTPTLTRTVEKKKVKPKVAVIKPYDSSTDVLYSYSMYKTFSVGDYIEHSKFGIGKIISSSGDKLTVCFDNFSKILIQGKSLQ